MVEKLAAGYPQSRAALDEKREPSVKQMAEAVGNLGKRLIVRLDGRGGYKSIQAAIDAASANSTIEIQGNGPYYEMIRIPEEKTGLTLRGRQGTLPVISAGGPLGDVKVLLAAPDRTTLERVAIKGHITLGAQACIRNVVNEGGIGVGNRPSISDVVSNKGGIGGGEQARIRNVVITRGGFQFRKQARLRNVVCRTGWPNTASVGEGSELDNCCLNARGQIGMGGDCVVKNCVFPESGIGLAAGSRAENVFAKGLDFHGSAEARFCTIAGRAKMDSAGSRLSDSIVESVVSEFRGHAPDALTRCDTYKTVAGITPGEGCINVDPMFVNSTGYDYHLALKSPCRKKASDGGDLGVRFTPEMAEVLKTYLSLPK